VGIPAGPVGTATRAVLSIRAVPVPGPSEEETTAEGMSKESVESLLEWLKASRTVDQAEQHRPVLGLLHQGRAEAFAEVIGMVEIRSVGS
jgi:hypothetical protein